MTVAKRGGKRRAFHFHSFSIVNHSSEYATIITETNLLAAKRGFVYNLPSDKPSDKEVINLVKSETANWKALETEYITTTITQRAMAKKYGIPLRTITYQSRKGNWVEKRQRHCDRVAAKTTEKIIEKQATTQANRLLRLVQINDKLLDTLEESAEQLKRREVKRKTKTKVVEYKNQKRPDKPTKEIITEHEELDFVEGDIDRAGLKHLSASMKNIADTYLKERAARKEDDDASGVAIQITGVTIGDAEEFSG